MRQIIAESLDLLPEIYEGAPDLTDPDNIRPFSDLIFDAVEPLIPEAGLADFRANRKLNNEHLDKVAQILSKIPEIPDFAGPDNVDLPEIVIPDIEVGHEPQLSN